MKQFIRLFAKEVDNVDLAEAMRYAFDHNCVLHTYHYEDEESEIRMVKYLFRSQIIDFCCVCRLTKYILTVIDLKILLQFWTWLWFLETILSFCDLKQSY